MKDDDLLLENWKSERRVIFGGILVETKIRSYFRKWNESEMPTNMLVFWGAVHKAITGMTDLPIFTRRISKAWLDDHGLQSLDDGDL